MLTSRIVDAFLGWFALLRLRIALNVVGRENDLFIQLALEPPIFVHQIQIIVARLLHRLVDGTANTLQHILGVAKLVDRVFLRHIVRLQVIVGCIIRISTVVVVVVVVLGHGLMFVINVQLFVDRKLIQ